MKRSDGRRPDELRKTKATRHYLKDAEGSCLIEFGGTRVICSASLEENVPPFLRGRGEGWVTAEYGMLPRSCGTRISRDRAKNGRVYEIQRLVGRSLRSVVDMKAMGERTIFIDCDVIQADGGTRCASITGSFIALMDCLAHMRRKGMVAQLPVRDFVAAVSVGLTGGIKLLDLTYEEDSAAEVDMNVVMTGAGDFVEIQGTAEKRPFSKPEMEGLLALAKKGICHLIYIQEKALRDVWGH